MTLAFDLPPPMYSPLSRLDPRWKLAGLVPAAIMVGLLQSPLPTIASLALTLLLVIVARLPVGWVARRLGWTALFLSLFLVWLPFFPAEGAKVIDLGWLRLSASGTTRFGLVLAKALALVALMLVLVATATLPDLGKAARCLGVPGVLVQLLLLTFRYVSLLADEFARLRTALRVRGYRNRAGAHSYRTIGQVAGVLLVRGQERADRVSHAMRCRGFDGQFRTLHEFHRRPGDVVFFLLIVVAATGLLAWDQWLRA